MKKFEERKFDIPALKGISAKSIEEHLKLYAGYVKNLNGIYELAQNPATPEYALREAFRRQAFEWGGMRNHELYFSHFEGGAKPLSADSALSKKIAGQFGSTDAFLAGFKGLATTRGVGWAMLGYDKATDTLVQYWVDEQHLGHLPCIQPILCLDLWEHSYVADYQPSGRKQYVEDFFANLNWQTAETYYEYASGAR
ncbi:MAG TPA: Fe-Mn family superoxide dismutase [Candidatus Paceibacterota bacterium]|nr:Fe-Mn family superoxide dismutase [Candidatus Paceibacterota bacterium]